MAVPQAKSRGTELHHLIWPGLKACPPLAATRPGFPVGLTYRGLAARLGLRAVTVGWAMSIG